ncbi:uncharacterized protein LOC130827702 [Amaranthus tricolor]|uniref:uncharacterized protein LOC130827702 n=1 Tax=Amaranthus tricolor TaxID=29722 RepID=UPI0025876204|nr:uncharacterized protein LOC130827702 [Amaranthus tricolor]
MMLLTMERRNIHLIFLIATFLSMISKSNGQFRPSPTTRLPTFPALRPLCLSQFTLVNHACSVLPYSPMSSSPPKPPSSPPPSPPAPSVGAQSPCSPTNTSRRHRHHHRHRSNNTSNNESHLSVAEDECCRWLKEVDTQCVCDLLVRLPVFLAKPAHDYTVVVTDDCSVTYHCLGRVIT